MRLILDSNILIAALIRRSTVRRLILKPGNDFYAPEFILSEISKHRVEICRKSGLGPEVLDAVLALLLERIHIVPAAEFNDKLAKAHELIGDVDSSDVPYVALAISITNDGIWSDDTHFQKMVSEVRIWKTRELVHII